VLQDTGDVGYFKADLAFNWKLVQLLKNSAVTGLLRTGDYVLPGVKHVYVLGKSTIKKRVSVP